MALMNQPLNPNQAGAQQIQQYGGGPPGGLTGVSMGAGNAWHYLPPEAHLVQGRLNGLQNENSNYLRQARQAAMELSNARGQANSSYAAGAAQRAAIDAALPIAAQDSETLTRIGLTNAQASQRQWELEQQMKAQQGGGGAIQMVDPYATERQMAHDLQLQRERLAFEGEQGALGRDHDFGMGNFGLMRDLTMGQAGYGWDVGRMGVQNQFNQDMEILRNDLGMSRDEFQSYLAMNQGLFQHGLGLESDYLNTQWGTDAAIRRDLEGTRFNAFATMLNNLMQVPEFMANPEAFGGFMQWMSGPIFDSIFGGAAPPRGG